MGNDGVAGHPIPLITKVLLCGGHPLVSIHMGHKYLHIPCPFREAYDLDSLSPVFQSRSFQVPGYLVKPLATAHEPNLCLWPFLFKMNSQVP